MLATPGFWPHYPDTSSTYYHIVPLTALSVNGTMFMAHGQV